MNFRRVEPHREYRALRLISGGGHWELGLSPYSHGMRLRMGHAGRPPRVMDFCLGRDVSFFPTVLVAVLRKLEPLEESSTPEEIDAAFPWAGTRPDMAVHLAKLLDQEEHGPFSVNCAQPAAAKLTGVRPLSLTNDCMGSVHSDSQLF